MYIPVPGPTRHIVGSEYYVDKQQLDVALITGSGAWTTVGFAGLLSTTPVAAMHGRKRFMPDLAMHELRTVLAPN